MMIKHIVQRNVAKTEKTLAELDAKLQHEQAKLHDYLADLKVAEQRCAPIPSASALRNLVLHPDFALDHTEPLTSPARRTLKQVQVQYC